MVYVVVRVDANANYNHNVRDDHLVPLEYYGYVQYYFVHLFRGIPHMLMYCNYYRNIEIHDRLVEDKGHGHYDVQNIRVLRVCIRSGRARFTPLDRLDRLKFGPRIDPDRPDRFRVGKYSKVNRSDRFENEMDRPEFPGRE
jgi:hypothetical protein